MFAEIEEQIIATADHQGRKGFYVQLIQSVGVVLDVDPGRLNLRAKLGSQGLKGGQVVIANAAPSGAQASHK